MKLALVLAVAFLSSVSSSEKLRFDGCQVYRVVPKTLREIELLRELEGTDGFRFWSDLSVPGRAVDIMVFPAKQQHFLDFANVYKLNTKLFISDVQGLIDGERPQTRTTEDFGWTDYYELEEINAWLESIAAEHPTIVTLIKAGVTYEGRDILGVKLSFSPENKDRAVFMEANIHAREWISSAVATFVINEFLTSNEPTVRALAESRDWYIVPVFNPDGFAYSHSTDRMWRKTRSPHDDCFGVDPNRNWGYHWNEGGASSYPCSDTYNGPNPFSENSTRTLSEFIATIGSNLQAFISLHSYSQLLLIPYGYSSSHLDNYDDLLSVGQKVVTSLAQRYGTQFEPGNIVEILYTASGGSMDWVKGEFKTPITYTYELRDQGYYAFILPADQIIPSSLEFLDSLVTMFVEFDKIL